MLLLTAVLGATLMPVRAFPAQTWQRQVQARANELRAKNGNGTDERFKKQLLSMEDEDQGARGMRAVPPNPDLALDDDELAKVDAKITAQLKQLVAEHGWPTIALVGSQASQAAVVMLVHSADHAWQQQLLPELQKLVEADNIFGSDVATLIDRLLVSLANRSGSARSSGPASMRLSSRRSKIGNTSTRDAPCISCRLWKYSGR